MKYSQYRKTPIFKVLQITTMWMHVSITLTNPKTNTISITIAITTTKTITQQVKIQISNSRTRLDVKPYKNCTDRLWQIPAFRSSKSEQFSQSSSLKQLKHYFLDKGPHTSISNTQKSIRISSDKSKFPLHDASKHFDQYKINFSFSCYSILNGFKYCYDYKRRCRNWFIREILKCRVSYLRKQFLQVGLNNSKPT